MKNRVKELRKNQQLTQEELDRLAIISPNASVAIIRDYRVAEKRTVELGSELRNIARCSFSNCITKNPREPLPHKLKIISAEPMKIRCFYCGKNQNIDEMVDYII